MKLAHTKSANVPTSHNDVIPSIYLCLPAYEWVNPGFCLQLIFVIILMCLSDADFFFNLFSKLDLSKQKLRYCHFLNKLKGRFGPL